ncbi:MAG: porin [Rhodobacteraceae bacterium]|nr:porin [Paracoccaceae bacterium]
MIKAFFVLTSLPIQPPEQTSVLNIIEDKVMGEMRKFMVFTSTLALSVSMSFAMEKDAMDEGMMMEEVPSVAVGGSGKIGIKNVDDSSDPDAEQFKLVRAYKVTFDSTGTTDGGLMFGAGMSIRDDTGEKDVTNDEGEKVQGPAVKGSYVFVGGADGSWKLQFGGNDPGIDLAGGFGVADDHFGGGDDATIALSGSFGDTSYRITVADPGTEIEVPVRPAGFDLSENFAARDAYDAAVKAKANENDWSVGVSHSINTISVGVGMDSEDGLAIGVGTDLSGVSTFVYWSKSELKDVVVRYDGPRNGEDDVTASQENSGLGVKASMSPGEGATFSVGYSTLKLEQDAAATFAGTAKTKLIEVDFSYDLGGGATLKAGIDKRDEETLMNGLRETTVVPKDTTTLEAAIAFSF